MATSERRFYGTLGEPDAHCMMRRTPVVVRALLFTAVLTALILLLFYRSAAHLAAIPVPVLWFVLVIVGHFERHARASVLRSRGQTAISQTEVETDVDGAGIVTSLAVAGGLLSKT